MTVILGGGLAGLSAGYVLSHAGRQVTVIERNLSAGGLARTVEHCGFRYDLGGHRFLTKDEEIARFTREVLREDMLTVARKSAIYLNNRLLDYPLKPANALSGLGLLTSMKALIDYAMEKARGMALPKTVVSLEDWVVHEFGRTLFNIYFKQYSEKVWGIDCRDISYEWVARRIEGLSLRKALQNAFFSFAGRGIDTLAERFLYPRRGIGQIAECLARGVFDRGAVMTGTEVRSIEHDGSRVRSVTVRQGGEIFALEGDSFISTVPLPRLIASLRPLPPGHVLDAASGLHFRDIVIVTLMLRRERITNLTWLYLPEKTVPVGRVHEPKNWSLDMAPQGRTHIVAEYFCFRGDRTWNASDSELIAVTANTLQHLGFIRSSEILCGDVVRVPHAYPLLDTGYRSRYATVLEYLGRIANLHLAGRGGTFQYLNMDHAIRSGIHAAQAVLGGADNGLTAASQVAEAAR